MWDGLALDVRIWQWNGNPIIPTSADLDGNTVGLATHNRRVDDFVWVLGLHHLANDGRQPEQQPMGPMQVGGQCHFVEQKLRTGRANDGTGEPKCQKRPRL